MRHAPVLVVLALVLAAPAAAPAQPAPVPGEALFAVSGRGYGHGVGMSQYGAYGQALEGRTYDQILEHYYPGTELARARGRELRVLLAEGRRALAISSPVPFSAVDATGETFRLPAGPLALRADLALPVEPAPVEAVPPLVLRPGRGGPLSVDGRAYRGKVEVAVQGAFLRAVNLVGLELYLRGVVPGEMPFGWPLEALKAQAVAARSYALASLLQGKPFHLYADVRSQAYGGVAVEKPSTTRAVSETAGQVLLYGGRVATTYYFSTSGGRTASAADVFGFASPYLVSRPDPWDRVSPYHRWGPVLFGARTLGAKLGLRAGLRALDATGLATPSGRLRSLRVVTTAGEEAFPASLLRTALGLRSTWVTVSVLRLDRPRGTLAFGGRLRLEGLARGVAAASLAASADGAEWSPVAALRRDAAGRLSAEVAPARSTRYRIEADGLASPVLLVRVAPRVTLERAPEPGVLVGSVRPRLSGTPVVVERREGRAWIEAATATVDAGGGFRVELALRPGEYRARVGPLDGYAEGVSPTVAVSP